MREVKPTQKPVSSSDIKDLFFNSGLLDIWATSLERKYIDRFGNCHLTAAGMEWLFKELVEKFKVDMNIAIVAAGYITIDSFQQGADLPSNELTQRNHVLRDEATGEYYRWDGDLPKQVLAGSTPQSTGGIGKGAWVSVGDASLRSDINILVATFNSINEMLQYKKEKSNKIASVTSYHIGLDSGDNSFVWDSSLSKSLHNGGTIIDPIAPYPSVWANREQRHQWFNSKNQGFGCWVSQSKTDIDVTQFGAVGDNVVDDTQSIQAAIDAARDSTLFDFSKVYFPKLRYKVSKSMKYEDCALYVHNGVELVGDSTYYDNAFGYVTQDYEQSPIFLLDFDSWEGVVKATLQPTRPVNNICIFELGSKYTGINFALDIPSKEVYPTSTPKYQRYTDNTVNAGLIKNPVKTKVYTPNLLFKGCIISSIGGDGVIAPFNCAPSFFHCGIVNLGGSCISAPLGLTDAVIRFNEFQSFCQRYVNKDKSGVEILGGTAVKCNLNRFGNDRSTGAFHLNTTGHTQGNFDNNSYQAANVGATIRGSSFNTYNNSNFKECRIGLVSPDGYFSATGCYLKGFSNDTKSQPFNILNGKFQSYSLMPIQGYPVKFIGTKAPYGFSRDVTYYITNVNLKDCTFELSRTVCQNSIQPVKFNERARVNNIRSRPSIIQHTTKLSDFGAHVYLGVATNTNLDTTLSRNAKYVGRGVTLYSQHGTVDIVNWYPIRNRLGQYIKLMFGFSSTNIDKDITTTVNIKKLEFILGSSEIKEGDFIKGLASQATATVTKATVESGSWEYGNASGFLTLKGSVADGSFSAGELLSVSGTNKAKVQTTNTTEPVFVWKSNAENKGHFHDSPLQTSTGVTLFSSSNQFIELSDPTFTGYYIDGVALFYKTNTQFSNDFYPYLIEGVANPK